MAEVAEPPVALFKKRGHKAKSNLRKRPATPPPAADDDDDSEYASSADERGSRRVKRVKRNAGVDAGVQNAAASTDLKATQFAADTSSTIQETNDATATSHWFDNNTAPSSATLLGNSKKLAKPARGDADGTYQGQAAYSNYLQKHPDAPDKKIGPQKASANVRTITVTDFAPDVCKDYKQTGFCGFGDSCKFLHMREDYKQGWQLDNDWEKAGDAHKKGTVVGNADRRAPEPGADADAKLLEGIPFVCILCKKDYRVPIVTRCGHYFCERCALDRYRKNPNCAACGVSTGGVFNVAKNLKKLLERKRERLRAVKREKREAGEEVSSDEEVP